MANVDIQKQSTPVGPDVSTEALVSWNPFPPDQDTGINYDINSDEHCITLYELESRWVLNEGLIAVPLAKRPTDPAPDMEFLRLHKPLAFLVIDWACGRIAAPPVVPIPYLSDTNLVLLRQEHTISGVDRDRDGRLFFWATGTYWYGAIDRKKTTLSHGVPPYITILGNELVTWNPQQPNGAIVFLGGIPTTQWPDPSMHTYLTNP